MAKKQNHPLIVSSEVERLFERSSRAFMRHVKLPESVDAPRRTGVLRLDHTGSQTA
jgi:hypothetical protein